MTAVEWLEAEFDRLFPTLQGRGCYPRHMISFLSCDAPDEFAAAQWPTPVDRFDLDLLEGSS